MKTGISKRFNPIRLKAIIVKEFIQIKRDKISLRIPIAMPVMMMLLFGYVVNTEADNISLAVYDQSRTYESRELIASFQNSGYFIADKPVLSEAELVKALDTGDAKAGLYIPASFARDLKAGRTPQVQFVVDGSDTTTARTALSSGALVAQSYSAEKASAALLKAAANAQGGAIDFNTKVWYNPNLESNRFTIPGLVGLILQNITIMLTAFSMVRERERGTIEQLIVTPVRSNELILGKLIPYILIGYAGFLFSLALCVFWFKVSVRGSVPALLLLGGLFVISSLAVGLLISTIAKNQLQAMMGTMLVVLPSVLLSGFMFPIEAMPAVIRPLSYAIPLTYFLEIIRGIITKGVPTAYLIKDALALSAFLAVILFAAIRKFKKNLD